MNKFSSGVTKVNDKLGKTFSYLIYPGMFILVAEVILRYVFDSPTVWVHGYSQRIFGSYFILIGALTLIRGGHVRVDLIYNRLQKRARVLLDVINYALLIIWTAILVRAGWGFFMYSFRLRQVDEMVLRHPIYPVKFLLVVGMFLILIQGVAYIIPKIAELVRGETYEHRTDHYNSDV